MNGMAVTNIKAPQPADAVQQTVMVVDDNATMRMIIQKELERAGFTVATFSNSLEALSFLDRVQKPPDLITLDISMPILDGFDCCEIIREQEGLGLFGNPETRIPVLFISAHDTFEYRRRSFNLGSLEFIAKPFAHGDITTAVNRVLRPQSTFAGMVALVVGNNQDLRIMVGSCLQRIGLSIIEAENGQQAFDIVSKNPNRIDLAIIDFDMPAMRGDELIHLIRQLPEAEHLPLISLSVSGGSSTVLHMFRAGASDYLVKPFIAEELLARVQVHLQLRRHVCHLETKNRNLFLQAVNDKLTGLHNKHYFQMALEEMFAKAKHARTDISCLFFDLDHFKNVNDTNGHDFGDYVLKTVGDLVIANVRSGDLTARFGGEEFVIALPGISLDNAMFVAEKIRTVIAKYPFIDQGRQWPVTVSIGVASLFSNRPESASTLLQLADQALYLAKNYGRNRVCFLS